jgi:hypothetical protein
MIWEIACDGGVASFLAMDQLLSVYDLGQKAVQLKNLSPDSKLDYGLKNDKIKTMLESNAFPESPHIYSYDLRDGFYSSSQKNILLIDNVNIDKLYKNDEILEKILRYDEIWTPDKKLAGILKQHRLDQTYEYVPEVSLPDDTELVLPYQGNRIIFCVANRDDWVGMLNFIGYYMGDDQFKDDLLVIYYDAINDNYRETIQGYIASHRISDGHKALLLSTAVPYYIDGCIIKSDIVVCPETQNYGWNHILAKAAVAKKAVILGSDNGMCAHMHGIVINGLPLESKVNDDMVEQCKILYDEAFNKLNDKSYLYNKSNFINFVQERI